MMLGAFAFSSVRALNHAPISVIIVSNELITSGSLLLLHLMHKHRSTSRSVAANRLIKNSPIFTVSLCGWWSSLYCHQVFCVSCSCFAVYSKQSKVKARCCLFDDVLFQLLFVLTLIITHSNVSQQDNTLLNWLFRVCPEEICAFSWHFLAQTPNLTSLISGQSFLFCTIF